MGLFSKRPVEPVDDTSMRYLSSAPPGPRTDLLGASIIHAMRRHPIAEPSLIGSLPSYAEMAEAGLLVTGIMKQDHALNVIVARKLGLWASEVSMLLANHLDEFYAAAGVAWSGGDIRLLRLEDSNDTEPNPVLATASLFAAFVMAAGLGPQKAPAADWKWYSDLCISSHTQETRTIAYDMATWAAIATARLLNAGRVDLGRADPSFPPFNHAYREVVALTTPGWYPNPQKVGGIVDGDAKIQRFWDGDDWTPRARVRDGGRWTNHEVPLNSSPVN